MKLTEQYMSKFEEDNKTRVKKRTLTGKKKNESDDEEIKAKIKANNDKMTALKKRQDDGEDVQQEIDDLEAENDELNNVFESDELAMDGEKGKYRGKSFTIKPQGDGFITKVGSETKKHPSKEGAKHFAKNVIDQMLDDKPEPKTSDTSKLKALQSQRAELKKELNRQQNGSKHYKAAQQKIDIINKRIKELKG